MPTFLRGIAAAALACLLLAAVGIATPVSAAQPRSYALYGSTTSGWGLTNESLMSPGPPLYAEVGDNLILNLTSVDGNTHRWFLDYDNDSAADPNEPRSANFGPILDDWILYNFTVSNQTGTFPYRSDRNPPGPANDLTMMWGNITIAPAGTGGGPLESGVVIAGIVILAIAAVAVFVFLMRRSRSVPPPPPPPPPEG